MSLSFITSDLLGLTFWPFHGLTRQEAILLECLPAPRLEFFTYLGILPSHKTIVNCNWNHTVSYKMINPAMLIINIYATFMVIVTIFTTRLPAIVPFLGHETAPLALFKFSIWACTISICSFAATFRKLSFQK